MGDLLNDLSTEVIEEVTEAFLNARRAGASKLAAYMIARAVFRKHYPNEPIDRPIIFAMVEAAEHRLEDDNENWFEVKRQIEIGMIKSSSAIDLDYNL